jgi:hypothetical protein
MTALNYGATPEWNEHGCGASGRTKITIDLPADRVLQDSALIDRLIGLAFDRLGQIAVEMRVLEVPEPGESNH